MSIEDRRAVKDAWSTSMHWLMLCEAIVVRVCFKLSSPVQQETLGATLDKLLTSTRETTEFLQVQLDENAIPDVQFRRLGPDLLQMMN